MRLAQLKPREIATSIDKGVSHGLLLTGSELPALVEVTAGTPSPVSWAKANWKWVQETLLRSGGVLFRGFPVRSAEEFGEFVRSLSPELLEYKERSTPRTEVQDRIYTSTEYPSHQRIAMHNEFSYAYAWPMKIFFFAHTPPASGGETPIADSRCVFQSVGADVQARFVEKGVMYVRNYGQGIDLTWQNAFQTTSRSDVEEYCRQAPMEFEWLSGDRLRTRQVRPSTASHPVTGETVWFNQAHLFHVSNLNVDVRRAMTKVFPEDELPRQAYFGDGTAIPDEDLDQVRRAYTQSTIAFRWQQGDILLLDNMLVAHGRNPYTGTRRILAALTEMHKSSVAL